MLYCRQYTTVIAITLLCLFGSLFTAGCKLIQQPSNNSSSITSSIKTQTQSLAGDWSFKIDPYNVGADEKWWQEDLNATHWDHIKVPGVWDVYDRYHDYTGTAWYRYEFSPKDINTDDKIQLIFDSVYHDSEVWLNDTYLGKNSLGFMSFKFDIEKHLRKSQSNTLALRVNNRVKRGAVWNWGGIRFPVYLSITPKTYIERVYVTATPDLSTGKAALTVKTKIHSENVNLKQAALQINITREGKNIYSNIVNKAVVNNEELNSFNFVDSFILDKALVDLWHFNDPNLYDVQVTLLLDDKQHHQIEDRFGIRKVETKNNALYLNGEKIRLNGFNMVPEDRFDGNALPLSRIKEDVDLLKTLNGNFARLSGPALPKAYLDYLDEVGFLLIEEVGLWGKDKLVDPDHPLPKEWLKRLVNDHYNHPSIVAWSVGNEIGDLKKNPKALEYVEGAIKHSKELDPSRMAVYISYSADYQADDPSQFSDIVMFNKYDTHEEKLKKVHEFHTDKAIFFSEIGTKLDGVDPNDSTIDPQGLWNNLKQYPYLIGTSHFAFSDYRSDWKSKNLTWSTDDSENRAWGVLTAYRTPKRSFEKLRNFNAPIEELAIKHNKGKQFEISITPKTTNTFPAFILKNYQIVWTAKNKKNGVFSAGTIALPTIKPGDTKLSRMIDIEKNFAKLTANLIDPFGYIVKKVDIYQHAPKAPEIKKIFSSLDTIRVTYDKTEMADEYQLEAVTHDGKTILGKKTINDFAEVTGLEGDNIYSISLKAFNPVGESVTRGNIKKVVTTPAELPPIIWSVASKDDAFHIGFSVSLNDFKYEIQYGLASGEYSKSFLIDTHGATHIPALQPGQDHYFRLRRLITGSVDSEWTEEIKVIFPNENGLSAPTNALIIPAKDGIVLNLTPVQGATGYQVKWENKNGTHTVRTKLAYSSYITIAEPSLAQAKQVEIATVDKDGKVGPYRFVNSIR
ncbi:glycoside hydrolase family 2 [Colwellia sp. UCD-KL20]|uniref:glycoside hydrolase family 2 n=1 Tax=Colwellia sp. UCD-KL20 TaxID=1917165 RepID=UPI00097141F9|nr:glycoside hydrolase family 2 [Colwellia sp. UCD-KL20]